MTAHSTANCLNCAHTITGKFCSACGQKADTHRITLRHFFMHDLLHGLWHVEKGLFFTLKESFLRPGTTAKQYIAGHRIRYYNFFYLLLILLGLNALTGHWFQSLYHLDTEVSTANTSSASLDITAFLKNNFKLLIFLLVPFFAINGSIVFRRTRYNIAEHAIVAANILLAGATWWLVINLVFYTTYHLPGVFWDVLMYVIFSFVLLLPLITYVQATRTLYRWPGFLWRIACWYLLCFAEMCVVVLIVFLVSGKTELVIN